MRWKAKKEPSWGSIKRVNRFAMVPVMIGDVYILFEWYHEIYEYNRKFDVFDELFYYDWELVSKEIGKHD